MKPIDVAVKFIKALPEQQGFTMREQLPTLYGQDMTEAPSFLSLQQRRGTIHPAILGMIERRQKMIGMPTSYMPSPDRRMRVGRKAIDGTPLPDVETYPFGPDYGTLMAQGPKNEMTNTQGEFSNNSEDAAQFVRGSVFDSGHFNRYGLPMVGVRQPNYQEQRKPLNPELNRRRY